MPYRPERTDRVQQSVLQHECCERRLDHGNGRRYRKGIGRRTELQGGSLQGYPVLGKDDKDGLYPQEISFDPVKARYVEVIIKSDKLPTWHGGAGNPAFLFVDEINLQ